MKWVVASIQIGQEIYELWSDKEKLVTLEFHPSTHSARLITRDKKRVFQFRNEGFRKNKIALRNEYGIQIGRLEYEKRNPKEGVIDLEEEKFAFKIEYNSATEMRIYNEITDIPLSICVASPGDKSTLHNKGNFQKTEHILLLTFCWFQFTPVLQKNMQELVL